jgi:hypothetical protein
LVSLPLPTQAFGAARHGKTKRVDRV